jgi:hypothetical protein
MTSPRTAPPATDQLPLFGDPRSAGALGNSVAFGRVAKPEQPSRRDVFNARLTSGLTLVGTYDIPKLWPCDLAPAQLVAFSEAMAAANPRARAWVHFYEDDYRFIRLWRQPEKYLPRLRGFAGAISPDFSLYRDMPEAQKIAHTYMNQLLGAWMQANGMAVIANVRLSGRTSIPYALAGVPDHATIALGLHGCTRDPRNRPRVSEEVRIVCEELQPARIVVYGSTAYGVLDYPRELGIPVQVFTPDTYQRSHSRRAAA